MNQNVFDNEVFFENYQQLRKDPKSYNKLVEQPAIKKLLPELKGKTILDLGCGFGENCIGFVYQGASKVLGIDISRNMLEVARNENPNEKIEYYLRDMSEIGSLNHKFDLVFSSLAFHYVKDFKQLLHDIYTLLNENGILLFSQEHPYTTAPKNGPAWTKNESGQKLYYHLSDYMESGERHTHWFVDNVEKYHRPMSEIINLLVSERFRIDKVVEPVPDETALQKRPDLIDEFHKTSCIIVKATKI